MSTEIKLLEEHVINRIAAGESVGSPSAIIKELVENALDAGSSRISVTVQNGGKDLILVQDDGHGMTAEDLPVSILRHATSKIKSFEDLTTINSHGFRGEALASIASVSEFKIQSGRDKLGHVLMRTNGEMSVRPAPYVKGTQVWVSELFKMVPARRKFLKGDRAETLAVISVVKAAALSRPDVAFDLFEHSGDGRRTLLSYPPETLQRRVQRVMGDGFFKVSLPVDLSFGEVHVQGYVASSSGFRSVIGDYYVLINGRNVRSPEIMSGVREGFGSSLPKDKHAPFVLFVSLPGEEVDVNVHPAKSEVRFKWDTQMTHFIKCAVQKALPDIKPRTTERNSLVDARPEDSSQAFMVIGDWELVRVGDKLFSVNRRGAVMKMLDGMQTQSLSVPLPLDEKVRVSPEDASELNRYGFEVSAFGSGTYALTGVPSGVDADPRTFPSHIKTKGLIDAALSWALSAMTEKTLSGVSAETMHEVNENSLIRFFERSKT